MSEMFPLRYFAGDPGLDGNRHPAGADRHLRVHRRHEVHEVPGGRRGAEDVDGCHWGRDLPRFR